MLFELLMIVIVAVLTLMIISFLMDQLNQTTTSTTLLLVAIGLMILVGILAAYLLTFSQELDQGYVIRWILGSLGLVLLGSAGIWGWMANHSKQVQVSNQTATIGGWVSGIGSVVLFLLYLILYSNRSKTSEAKLEAQSEARPRAQSEARPRAQSEARPRTQSEAQPEAQSETQSETQSEAQPEAHPRAHPTLRLFEMDPDRLQELLQGHTIQPKSNPHGGEQILLLSLNKGDPIWVKFDDHATVGDLIQWIRDQLELDDQIQIKLLQDKYMAKSTDQLIGFKYGSHLVFLSSDPPQVGA